MWIEVNSSHQSLGCLASEFTVGHYTKLFFFFFFFWGTLFEKFQYLKQENTKLFCQESLKVLPGQMISN